MAPSRGLLYQGLRIRNTARHLVTVSCMSLARLRIADMAPTEPALELEAVPDLDPTVPPVKLQPHAQPMSEVPLTRPAPAPSMGLQPVAIASAEAVERAEEAIRFAD